MLAKVRGEATERIPFATYNLHPFGAHGKDPSYAPLLETVEGRAGMLVKHHVKRAGSGTGRHETRVEQSPSGRRVTTLWHTPRGSLRSVAVTPTRQPGYTVEHFIKSTEDIDRVMSVPPASVEYDAADTRRMVDIVGERGVLYVDYPDPMYSAASLFDFQEFCILCATDPGRVQALVDYFAEGIYGQVERLAAACVGLPVLFYTAGPEVATPPMLPPSAFARFVTPYQKRIIGTFHRYGHAACIHCHGRVRLVLDEILETGADALEPIEPPDQGDISLAELLDRVAGRMCLMGYIQDQDFALAPPGGMRRRVAEIAAQVAPSSRYVMMPTCTPFQFPAAPGYVRTYAEWLQAAEELLPG